MLGRLVVVVGAVIGAVNVALFVLWWSLIKVESAEPAERSEYVLEALSVQIAVLEVVLAAVGIALAVLGLFGYQSVKETAVNASVRETRTQVQRHLNTLRDTETLDTGTRGANIRTDNDLAVETEARL